MSPTTEESAVQLMKYSPRMLMEYSPWSCSTLKTTLKNPSSSAAWVAQVKKQLQNKKSQSELGSFAKQMGGAGSTKQMQQLTAHAGGNQDTQGSGATYDFRDSGDEVEITFKEEMADKKKVKVSFKANSLLVCYDGKEVFGAQACASEASATGGQAAAEGAVLLYGVVDVEESSWSIVDKTKLQITLMKKTPAKWPHVLK